METAQKSSSSWMPSSDLVVLILGLSVTFFGWRAAENLLHEQNKQHLLSKVDLVEQAFKSGFSNNSSALFGAEGLFSANMEVERDGFSTYFEGIDIKNVYPGIYSFTFISRVSDAQLPSFLENLKSEFCRLPVDQLN